MPLPRNDTEAFGELKGRDCAKKDQKFLSRVEIGWNRMKNLAMSGP